MATSGTGTRGTFDLALRLGRFTGGAVLVTGSENNLTGGPNFVRQIEIPLPCRLAASPLVGQCFGGTKTRALGIGRW